MQQAQKMGMPGREGLTIPVLMKVVYGHSLPRLVVLLREPSERIHSAFWEYFQYKSR